jgi:hypothetical protein
MSIHPKVPGDFKIFRVAHNLASAWKYPCVSASSAQSVFYRRLSAFICVHLRLISVSMSDRTRKIQFVLFSKINEKGLTESPQSMQRPSMSVSRYKMAAASRIRTRMTRIARIFTDLRVSASSAYLLNNKPYFEKINSRSNYS